MRTRLALLLGALVVPVLPLAPAQAAGPVLCVKMPAGSSCTLDFTDLQSAITAAGTGDAEIKLGPGTFTGGPFVLDGTGRSLTIDGSGSTGANASVLTMADDPAAQAYLTADHAVVTDLRVQMVSASSAGDVGLDLAAGSQVDNIVVVGDVSAATGIRTAGSTLRDARVSFGPAPGNTGVQSTGGNQLFDSAWNATTGYRLSSAGPADIVSQATLRPTGTGSGAVVDKGTLYVDDAVVEMGTSTGAGLAAGNPADAATARLEANHVTVVEGGPSSIGVLASATLPSAKQTSEVTLTNSIVRGPTTSLVAEAANDGAQGGPSSATLDVSYSDFQTKGGTIDGATGTGGINEGTGNLPNVDPGFVDAAQGNYQLRSGSLLVDKGIATLAALDRDGRTRSFDGDRNGVKVPDLGAYELVDVDAPKTVITGGPVGATNDNTPLFTFRSGTDATLECRLDSGAFQRCTSPVTTTPLPDGPHTFTVRATDEVLNVEPAPPTRAFTVDTKRPDTTLTKTPHKRFFKQRVKFKFTSNESSARFQCKLDSRPWRSCSSPFRYRVDVGKHRLLVRAIDAAGNVDRTPARYAFKRLKRHR